MRVLGLVTTVYLDDFPNLEAEEFAGSAEASMKEVRKVLGWEPSRNPAKSLPAAKSFGAQARRQRPRQALERGSFDQGTPAAMPGSPTRHDHPESGRLFAASGLGCSGVAETGHQEDGDGAWRRGNVARRRRRRSPAAGVRFGEARHPGPSRPDLWSRLGPLARAARQRALHRAEQVHAREQRSAEEALFYATMAMQVLEERWVRERGFPECIWCVGVADVVARLVIDVMGGWRRLVPQFVLAAHRHRQRRRRLRNRLNRMVLWAALRRAVRVHASRQRHAEYGICYAMAAMRAQEARLERECCTFAPGRDWAMTVAAATKSVTIINGWHRALPRLVRDALRHRRSFRKVRRKLGRLVLRAKGHRHVEQRTRGSSSS